MDKSIFIEKLKDVIQTEKDINFNTELESIEEWDSIAQISLLAFLDSEFNKHLTVNDFEKIKTVNDIAKIAGL